MELFLCNLTKKLNNDETYIIKNKNVNFNYI
jgi:hypothetical protein